MTLSHLPSSGDDFCCFFRSISNCKPSSLIPIPKIEWTRIRLRLFFFSWHLWKIIYLNDKPSTLIMFDLKCFQINKKNFVRGFSFRPQHLQIGNVRLQRTIHEQSHWLLSIKMQPIEMIIIQFLLHQIIQFHPFDPFIFPSCLFNHPKEEKKTIYHFLIKQKRLLRKEIERSK